MSLDRDKLLAKLRSYRFARIGAILLAVISCVALAVMWLSGQTKANQIGPVYSAAFVWPALAYIAHLKTRLIQIELARGERVGPSAAK